VEEQREKGDIDGEDGGERCEGRRKEGERGRDWGKGMEVVRWRTKL